MALLIALVLYVNQIPDRTGDAAAGKRTLIVRFSRGSGPDRVRADRRRRVRVHRRRGGGRRHPAWTLLALATLPLAWRVWNGLRAHYGDPYALMPTMQSNILLHLLTGLLFVIGYVIAVVS